MMKFNKKILPLSIVIGLIASFTTSIFAWFSYTKSVDAEFQPGDITISIQAYDSSNQKLTVDSTYNALVLNGGSLQNNELSEIDVDSFYVEIEVTAKVPVYVRATIQNEWFKSRIYYPEPGVETLPTRITSIYHEINPFSVSDEFVFDDIKEYAYYPMMINKNQTIKMNVLDIGCCATESVRDLQTWYETLTVLLDVNIEVVQANRYQQVWGINSIPTRGN